MANKLCDQRICDISEKDFWSSFKVGAKAKGSALAEAVAAGRKGRKEEAYKRLTDHHRASLADEWAHHHDRITAGSKPDRRAVNTLLQNKIRGWHAKVVDFGKQIDWSCQAWGQSGLCGFHYLGWIGPATSHYIHTGDTKTRNWLIRTVNSYYAHRNDDRPWFKLRLHPTYYELGSGGKARVLMPMYLALINNGRITTETAEAFNKLFLGFARSLHSLSEGGYRSGNWQINGCGALFQLACSFPEYADSTKWKRRAVSMLEAHVQRDFFADGGHKERCWSYGTGVAHHLGEAYDTAQRFGGLGKADQRVLRGIRKAYTWFAKSIGPTDHLPAYGDGQLAFAPNLLEQARKYFPKGTDATLNIDRGRSYLLDSSGYAIMRNGDDRKATYLNMNVGHWGGWHSHLDLLNVNLWSHGQPLIEEPGRYDGYDHPQSYYFRAPECHNLVTIEGGHWDNQNVDNRKAQDVRWFSNDKVDYVSAYHTAYQTFGLEPQSPTCAVRRTVIFVKDPGYALVVDTAHSLHSSTADFSLSANWHSPNGFRQLKPGLFRTKGGPACLLALARTDGLRHVETGYDFAESDYTGTGVYPERHYLRLRRWMATGFVGAVGFATLLYPFSGKQPAVSVKAIEAEGGEPWAAEGYEVRTPRGKDVILVNPEARKGVKVAGKAIAARAKVTMANGRGSVTVR